MPLNTFTAVDFPALLDLIYGAALDNNLWPVFLQRLLQPFDASGSTLRLLGAEQLTASPQSQDSSDPRFIMSYQELYSSDAPYPVQTFVRLPRIDPPPAIVMLGRETAIDPRIANEWLRPQGIAPRNLGFIVHNDGSDLAILDIASRRFDTDARIESDIKHCELLAPHLKRALALSNAARLALEPTALPAQFSCAALLVSAARSITAVNAEAQKVLNDASLIAIDALGKLRIKETDAHARLLLALQAVFERDESFGGPVLCRAPSNDKRTVVYIFKLPMIAANVALMLIIPAASRPAAYPRVAFTAAEARLARALLDGQTLADFSEQVGVSINTARKQLAALFAKTGTNRQATLVAWLLQRNF
jgi:DNA-binding CsgD family transcriptional regulator